MADARGIKAGRAFIEFFGDTSKLEAAMKRLSDKFNAMGKIAREWGASLAKAGLAVTAPLLATSKLAASMGEELYNMSLRTGITVEMLSALDYAASQAGTSLSEIELGVKNMQKALVKGAEGSEEAADALAKLGLSLDDLRGKSPDQQFMAIAKAISAIESPSQRTAIALALFGRSGTALLPMLRQGKKGIEELMGTAKEMGIVLSHADVKAAAEFNDKLTKLWKMVRVLGFTIGSVLIPPLQAVANATADAIIAVTKWTKQNKEAVVAALAIGVAVTAAGGALIAFGVTMLTIAKVVAVMTAIKAATLAMWGVMSAVFGVFAAVTTSPIFLLLTAVGLLTGAFQAMGRVVGGVITYLGRQFEELSRFAKESLQGIANAIISGDIQLAAEILWKSIEITWREGVGEVQRITRELGRTFGLVMDDLADRWRNMISELLAVWVGFKSTLNDIYAFLRQPVFGKALGDIDPLFDPDQLQRDMNQIRGNQAGENKAAEAAQDAKISSEGAAEAAKMAELQKELNQLRTKFNQLVGNAHQARFVSPVMSSSERIEDAIPGLESAQKSVQFGTFSAAAARAFGGSGGLEKAAKDTAKNTEDTAKGVEELARVMTQYRPAFR